MDEYTGDQVLRWYERMENIILKFSEHVPLVPENDNLKTPFLISCLIDSCGLLDSIFRDLVDHPALEKKSTKKKKNNNIEDYAKCFSTQFNLPNMRSVLLQAPLRYLTPFSAWSSKTKAGKYSSLRWWDAYNNLKHDRLTYIEEGTLGTTLNALCALHQVLARTPEVEMFRQFLRYGWIESPFIEPEEFIKMVEKSGTPTFGYSIFQTKLFSAPTGKRNEDDTFELTEFPKNIKELLPSRYRSSEELAKFMGRAGNY